MLWVELDYFLIIKLKINEVNNFLKSKYTLNGSEECSSSNKPEFSSSEKRQSRKTV